MQRTLFLKVILGCLIGMGFLMNSGCKDEPLIPDRDKFLGVFTVIETCGNGNDGYELTIIESGADESAVVILNLYDFGESLSATVTNSMINIPSQLVDGLTFSGQGSISDDALTLNFNVTNGIDSDNCNSICNRK